VAAPLKAPHSLWHCDCHVRQQNAQSRPGKLRVPACVLQALWEFLWVFGGTKGLAEHLGKIMSLSLVRPGFIVTRILLWGFL
jgi:hypothetical protein